MQHTLTHTLLALAASLPLLTSATPTSFPLEARNAYGGGIMVYTGTDCNGTLITHVNHDQLKRETYWPTGTTSAWSYFVKSDGHDPFVRAGARYNAPDVDPCAGPGDDWLAEFEHDKGPHCKTLKPGATCLVVTSSLFPASIEGSPIDNSQ